MARLKSQQQAPYQLFLDSIANPQTKRKYDIELRCYLKYLGITDANKLITPKLLDSPLEIRKTENLIAQYLKHLTNVEKLASATINVRLSAILSFYTINRVNINRKFIAKFKPPKHKIRKGDLSYSHKQINLILSKASTRDKVVILLMASTGMRIGALCTLTIGNLHKLTLDSLHIYKIIVYEGEPEQYYTFTTFELAAAIDDYLAEREHFGESLIPDAPLIRADFNHAIAERVQKPEFITTRGNQRLVDRLLVGARLRVSNPRAMRKLHTIMKSHGFRKFCITQMKLAKVDFSDREFLVGHRASRGLDVNYDRTSEDDRLQEYLKAVDLLTINEENRLRRQVADLEQKDQRIEQMEEQLSDMQAAYDEVIDLIRSPEKFAKMLKEEEE